MTDCFHKSPRTVALPEQIHLNFYKQPRYLLRALKTVLKSGRTAPVQGMQYDLFLLPCNGRQGNLPYGRTNYEKDLLSE